jgi:enoyl-CoA hydratase
MSAPVLLVEKKDGVATVTLNRPDAMNALNAALREALAGCFKDLQADEAVRVAILTGAGRAFCAGFDLKELASGGLSDGSVGTANEITDAMCAFDGPIIGAVNGVAVTGGFELALACDLMIASTAAKFADTHVRVGILPGWGLSQKLSRMIGIGRAKELSFTGNYLTAERAEAWGLVNRVVPPEELMPVCSALAADMASCDPRALYALKRLIDTGYCMTFGDSMAYESKLAIESARAMAADLIAARREAIRKRGQDQTKE